MDDKLNSRVLVSEFYSHGMKKPIRKYAVYGGTIPPATMELNGNRYIMPGWYKLPDDEPTPELKDIAFYPYKPKKANIPNIDILKDDCKVWLTTILAKYDPNRGSKAFSYFSVITKNWFIAQVKKNSKRAKREVDINDVGKEIFLKLEDTNTPVLDNMIEKELQDF